MVVFLLPMVVEAEFPEKPIQVLVGWPAGSMNDMAARVVAQVMQQNLKQPWIIQNVPGGTGALVLGRIKTVKPDGYTLFVTGTTMYSRTPHQREVPFDPLKDFAYLAVHGWYQYAIVVRSDSPWKTFDQLIDFVKKNPKKVRYATPSVGGSEHLMGEYIAGQENLQWVNVPFTAGTECITALMGGHVEVVIASVGNALEQIRAGRLRVLISVMPKRISSFPEVPSIMERGYKFILKAGGCWAVPAGTPKDVQRKLESNLLQAFKDQTVIDVLNKWNWQIDPLDSESFTKLIQEEYKIYGELLKKLGLGIYKKE